jgi:hypothetical protein
MERFKATKWEYDFRTHPRGSPLVGVLVESRDHPDIESALKNFSCMLPFASLCIMHSAANKNRILKILGPEPTNVIMIPLPEPFGRDECMKLWTSPEFWNKFRDFQRVLIFNIDTGIRQNTILKFMKYSYIGAHWEHQPTSDPRVFQGNGGFSLRDPRIMADICREKCPTPSCEDVWIGWMMANTRPDAILPASKEICAEFSTEGEDFYGTFGFHDTQKYNPKAYKVYTLADGPSRRLFNLESATLDGRDVTDLVRLGIGPNCIRIFNAIGYGKLVINNSLTFDLDHVVHAEIKA